MAIRLVLIGSENWRGQQLLNCLISERQHLAIVRDNEHVSGIVSLENMLKYLLGRQIVGEHDLHPKTRFLTEARRRFHGTSDHL